LQLKGFVGLATISTMMMNGSGYVHPNVAKVGGLQSQGAKGEAIVVYCEPLATQDMELSGFPAGEKRWPIIGPILKCTLGGFLRQWPIPV
jgi:hypothetical protein